jgi:hypothetical protein
MRLQARYFTNHQLGQCADDVTTMQAWDETVVSLMRWNKAGTDADVESLPHAAFYPQKGVGAVRSGWNSTSSYLAAKGGDSAVTHQDLDHGSYVWETKGYRWVVDLGLETYALPNMFLPFKGRYNYYRKSTRGYGARF